MPSLSSTFGMAVLAIGLGMGLLSFAAQIAWHHLTLQRSLVISAIFFSVVTTMYVVDVKRLIGRSQNVSHRINAPVYLKNEGVSLVVTRSALPGVSTRLLHLANTYPGHRDLLLNTGLSFHYLDQPEAAAFYWRQAFASDPTSSYSAQLAPQD